MQIAIQSVLDVSKYSYTANILRLIVGAHHKHLVSLHPNSNTSTILTGTSAKSFYLLIPKFCSHHCTVIIKKPDISSISKKASQLWEKTRLLGQILMYPNTEKKNVLTRKGTSDD